MRDVCRRALRTTAALTVLAATVALVPGPAGGEEEERITIREGETFTSHYPQIHGNDPEALFVHPDDCPAAPSCVVLPLTIEPPATQGAEFLVRFTLDWTADPDPSGLTSLHTHEMEMYLWHDPPKERSATSIQDEDAEPDENGERTGEDINPGAGFRKPQRINYFTTEPGDYQLIVSNRHGWNGGGWSLEIVYFHADIVPPTELGDPVRRPVDRSAGPAGAGAAPATPPSRPGGPPPAALDVEPAPGPLLEPLELDPADDFSVVSDGFDTALAAPNVTSPFPARARPVAAAPPSTAALLLWLVAFPLLLVAAGGAFLRRRNPATSVI